MGVKYTNNAATTLSSGINNSVTSVSVASSSTFPAITGSNYFYATFDDATNLEIVKVTAVSGTTWTIVRAQDDTSARAFSSGDIVELRINSAMLTDVVNDAMSDAFSRQAFTGDGSETDFTLSKAPATENDLIVFIEGVFQTQSAYSVSGTTLTFSSAPANSREIIVYHITAAVNGDSLSQNNFTGDGSDTTFTLSVDPLHENNTMVFLDGVYQHKATYSVSGTTLTFDAAPASGVLIECITHTQTEVNTPSSNSVVTASIVDDNVTQAKLADDAVGADQLASSAVVTASIVDDNVTQAKIADDAVGADQLASSAVVTASVVDDAITTAKIADDQITLAKMAGLARGKIIYGDSSGNPAALTVGSNGQVLKSDGTDISWGTDATVAALTSEEVQDIAGAMFTSNTETGITATYQDGDGTIDLVVGTLNQDTTGSAATLTTARTIGGVSFDGSANIAVTLAATATALATARTIAMTGDVVWSSGSFDGSGNVTAAATIQTDAVDIAMLSATGTASSSTFLRGDNSWAAAGADFDTAITINDSGADVDFRVESNNNANMFFVDGGTDAVGIGTNAPVADGALHVVGANGILVDTDGNGDGSIYFGHNAGTDRSYIVRSSDDLYINNLSAGNFTFSNNNSEAMRIDSSGRVGIGTNDPGASNDYAETLTLASSGNAGMTIRSGTSNYGSIRWADGTSDPSDAMGIIHYYHTNNSMHFFTNNAERMVLSSNGSLTLDSLSYDAAADSMTINNGLFLSSGYIRSGVADFSLGTASNGVMVTLDDSSNRVWAAGHVMQVVQGTGGAEIMTSGTFNTTGLSAAITPLKTSSKVLVTVTSSGTYNNGNAGLGIAIFRDSTEVCHHVIGGSSGNQYYPVSMSFLDSPSTTSSVTYTLQHRSENGSSLVGFCSTDPAGDDTGFIQLMEIGA